MKSKLLILPLICLSFMIVGQSIAEYKPIKFDDLDPIWTHAVHDSTIIGHEIDHPNMTFGFDGYSHVWSSAQNNVFEPIIQNGYLYNVNKTIYRNDLSGAILEKIDLETGQVMWKTTFDGRDSIRETVEKVVLKNDTLICYNILITSPEPDFPILPALAWGIGNGGGVLAIRKYLIDSGELVDYQIADQEDPNVKFLKPYAGNVNLLQPIGNNRLLAISNLYNPTDNGYFMIIDTLNFKGEFVNESDTIYSEFNIEWKHTLNTKNYKFLFDQSNHDIYWIDYYNLHDKNQNYIETKINLKRISSDLITTIDLDFIQNNTYYYFGLVSITENHILIYANHRNEDNKTYFLLDKSGSLIKTVSLGDSASIEDHVELDENGDFLIGHNTGTSGNYGYEVLKSEGQEFTQLINYVSSDPNYASYHHKITQLDNGDYLLYIVQFDDSPDITQPGRFYSILRVTEEMLGVGTSIIHTEQNKIGSISIYPNPVKDILNIKSSKDSDINDIIIHGSQANNVFHIANPKSRESLNVSYLSKGLYYISINFKDGTQVIRNIIKQ